MFVCQPHSNQIHSTLVLLHIFSHHSHPRPPPRNAANPTPCGGSALSLESTGLDIQIKLVLMFDIGDKLKRKKNTETVLEGANNALVLKSPIGVQLG